MTTDPIAHTAFLPDCLCCSQCCVWLLSQGSHHAIWSQVIMSSSWSQVSSCPLTYADILQPLYPPIHCEWFEYMHLSLYTLHICTTTQVYSAACCQGTARCGAVQQIWGLRSQPFRWHRRMTGGRIWQPWRPLSHRTPNSLLVRLQPCVSAASGQSHRAQQAKHYTFCSFRAIAQSSTS